MRFMLKSIKNKVIFILSICFILSAFCFAYNEIFMAKAVMFDGGEYKTEYFIGEEVEISHGKFIKDNAYVDADYEIIFPNGSVHKTEKFIIEQYGQYSVRYYSIENNYEKIVTFSANQYLYEVNGSGSANYDTYTVKNEYWSLRDGVDRYEEIPGVVVSLAPGAKFVYNKVVDLKQLNADEPLISLNIIAQQRGVPDFSRLNVRVTDIHNENNFLILRIKDKQVEDADLLSYCYVSINDEDVFYRGTTTTDGKYGISNMFSFRGLPGMKGNVVQNENCTSMKNDVLSYFVSHEKNEVFRLDSRNAYTSVCKLSETAADWDGFTTGEVKIEVFAELYKSATADFIVREIAGDSLTGVGAEDLVAPEINVNYAEEDKPCGKKGFSYSVFEASAFDTVDGIIKPQIFVYRNYHTNNKISVNVTNGRFDTIYTGIYTICYVATDSHGNQSTKLININVIDEEKQINYTFGDGVITAKQGDKVVIKDINAAGGYGNITYRVTVTCNGKEIEVKDNEFVATTHGEYVVSYLLTDYVGQYETAQYLVTISQSNEPVLSSDLGKVLEKSYIVGFNYPIPVIKMHSYDSAGNCVEKDATVTVNNATIKDGLFTPTTPGKVEFVYMVEGFTYTAERNAYSIHNGNDLDLNKMFITDSNVTASYATDANAKYFAQSDGGIEFINKLIADGFSLSFNTEKEYSNINSVNVFITDTENAKQKVKLSFINGIDGVKFVINDKTSMNVSYLFNGDSAKDFQLNLTAETGEIIVDKNIIKVLNYFDSDKKYSGFDSNKVYCRIEFEGVKESGFSFIVKNISGQNLLSTSNKDKIRPSIVFVGDYAGNRPKGENYTLPKAIAGDVITPYLTEYYLSVYRPNGDPVICNGIELVNAEVEEYSFVLSEYGEYYVEYKAVDAAGRENIGGVFSIKVYDLEPPTIKVSGMKQSCDVGATISIAKPVVKDNYAKAEELTICTMIKNPKGVLSLVHDYKFKAELKGTYTVYYYVFDDNKDYSNGVSQGSLGSASYTITVG